MGADAFLMFRLFCYPLGKFSNLRSGAFPSQRCPPSTIPPQISYVLPLLSPYQGENSIDILLHDSAVNHLLAEGLALLLNLKYGVILPCFAVAAYGGEQNCSYEMVLFLCFNTGIIPSRGFPFVADCDILFFTGRRRSAFLWEIIPYLR